MRFAIAILAAAPLLAQTPDQEFFEKKVRPIFVANCYACHGQKMQMGGLNLSTGTGAGPETGVIVQGDPEQSRLYQALAYSGKIKMPPSGKLSADDVAAVKTWIDMGGVWPASTNTTAAAIKFPISPEARKHWSFQPIRDYQPPQVKQVAWVKSPIDRFILAKLEEKNLQPAPPASKLTLLRRATYDLIGLPPTMQEIDAFLADKSPHAFAKVVDGLLASPKYGERWGRNWLDVARFAESTGMDEDNAYPHAWRYRDYVVDAFNQDLPYNRFVEEQIAGDLIPTDDPKLRQRGLVATGFLALGPRPLAQQDRLQMLYDVVDEQIDTTSKAFLGLTVACARCHDHKFDPILTKDYYSLASVFASTSAFRNQGRPGSISFMWYAPLDPAAYDRYQAHRWSLLGKQLEMEDALSEDLGRENAALRPKIAEFLTAAWKVQFQGASPDKTSTKWVTWLSAADEKARTGFLKDWFQATEANIAEVARKYQDAYIKTAEKWDNSLEKWRTHFAKDALQGRDVPARPKFEAEDDPFFEAATFKGGPMELPDSPRLVVLRKEFEQLEKSLPETPAMASAVNDGIPVDQKVFLHGDYHNPGEPVAKQFPIVLAGESQPPIKKGSGRLEMAQWLTSPDNPLPTRVMVNRIWQWHFGEALMRTPNNWGKMGEKPTHPELLDYLAKQFVANGWSIKSMHRQIMLSSTYQMSSKAAKESREADPPNRLWTRFNRVRMSVEQIRDSLLAIDGALDLTMGGNIAAPGKAKKTKADPDDMKRRTLYIPVKRGSIPNLLATFDYGDATTSNEGRPRTNVAPQALFMMNSSFVIARSQGFAKKLLDDPARTDAARIEQAYLIALARKPEPGEVDDALSYIASLEKKVATPEAHLTAWQSFCHVLMSSNEFLYLN